MKKSIFLTVLLGLFLVSTAIADPGDTLWTRTYGGSIMELCFEVQQTSDGGYVAVGFTYSFGAGNGDVWLVKTDANGDTLWTRTYGTSGDESGNSVRQTTDGGYIVAGFTGGFVDYDVYLVKTDANGDTLWTRTYGGSGGEDAESVQQTTDGGYIIAGSTDSFGAGRLDFYLVKTDANGDTLWTRAYGGDDWDIARSVQQTSDGGYVITGDTESFGGGDDRDVYLVKTDSSGDTLWTRVYGGVSRDVGESVQQTTDGGYMITGNTYTPETDEDFWLLKTDANGDTLWTRTYGGIFGENGFCGQQTTDGGYIMTGYTQSFGAGGDDVYLVKTDANGDTLWTRTYGGSSNDGGGFVQQTTDGGYIVSGYTMSFAPGYSAFYLVKVAGEAPQPDVSIEILPDDPPVTVPQGGSFGYTGTVTNNTEEPQVADAWVMAVGPLEGVYGPFRNFQDLQLGPSQARSAHLNQQVHNRAPLGFYNYIAYCGDYPSTVMDSSFFQIEVIAAPLTKAGEAGWVLTGSFLEGDLSELPSEFALLSNYPNPFNASTAISYELPMRAHVRLEVYNISGQKLATLVDGQQEAGYRSVTWEDSGAASGVYFYKLTAGDFTEVKRMTLLR
jgi:hypothetical protein